MSDQQESGSGKLYNSVLTEKEAAERQAKSQKECLEANCFCGSGKSFQDCCLPAASSSQVHSGV